MNDPNKNTQKAEAGGSFANLTAALKEVGEAVAIAQREEKRASEHARVLVRDAEKAAQKIIADANAYSERKKAEVRKFMKSVDALVDK